MSEDRPLSPLEIGERFEWRHHDVMRCRLLKGGVWSIRLRDGTPWPPAGHGATPDEAYTAAKVARVTRKLEKR